MLDMTYAEAVEYLFSSTPVFQHIGAGAYKPGLERVQTLADHYGHPERCFASIHIGGTNGKGSTSHTIASILQAQGYKVGLFTSPHLLDFRERIRVDGEMVTEDYVAGFVNQARERIREYTPSFFELTTMMAFCYFAHCQVDYAVIEVGLGGRLDCTNILRPMLSIITNVSLDHTQYLGTTLVEIASEKAGIIKPHVPVVIGRRGDKQVEEVFVGKAQELDAPLYFAEDEESNLQAMSSIEGNSYQSQYYGELRSPLGGGAQVENMRTILTAVRILSSRVEISPEAVHMGVAQVVGRTGLQGRWQWLSQKPRLVCDTAHNEDGIQAVVKQLSTMPYARLHIVLGVVADKDIRAILSLLPTEAHYYYTEPSVARALPAHDLQQLASSYHLEGEVYSSVALAVRVAISNADAMEDIIYVGGSNFVVADLLQQKIEEQLDNYNNEVI